MLWRGRIVVNGEVDLAVILRDMRPRLLAGTYVFCSIRDAEYGAFADLEPLASVVEPEGLTLVVRQGAADREGLNYTSTFRCISLQVHSSLTAVGLTAQVSSVLAASDISANMLAGYYHDHVLVPSRQAERALSLLESLPEVS